MASSSSSSITLNAVELPLLTGDPKTWLRSSLVSVHQITPDGLRLLFDRASYFLSRQQTSNDSTCTSTTSTGTTPSWCELDAKALVATVFYEASTRTACSFQAAAVKLGAKAMHVDSNHSSHTKGETLADTIRCLQCYADAIVLRHPVTGSIYSVLQQHQQRDSSIINQKKPLINAGDGTAEHPTQALLDVYTIQLERSNSSSGSSGTGDEGMMTLICLGDLKHGRTVHSLVQLLATTAESTVWSNRLTIKYCSPKGLEIPDHVVQTIQEKKINNVVQEHYTDLDEALTSSSSSSKVVLYVTRIQRERFESEAAYEAVKGSYVVDADLLKRYDDIIGMVLHPLPRVDEIATDVDHDPRAAYFRQMQNGLYIRMGILSLILAK
jgi:aspartate carbamoyltransferase